MSADQWTPTEYQQFWMRYGIKFLIGLGVSLGIGMCLGIVCAVALVRWLGWWK